MELAVDPMQSTAEPGVMPEVSRVWVLQPVRPVEPFAPEPRSYSYLAECECPDDCPRDHGNE